MTVWINVGAINVATGERFSTKKSLREAILADPSIVKFDKTSVFSQVGRDQRDLYVYCDDIRDGEKLSVVGPDPYNDRRWYANICKQGNRLKIS